jgi:hypothetical protein
VLSSFQNALLMLLTVTCTCGFLVVLQRFWPSELRRPHNDLIGWNVTVLGTTYAVIIGFMLFAVWGDFESAEAEAEGEANCLVNVARSSRGLPPGERAQVLNLTREYVDVMLTKEWAAMAHGQLSPASHAVIRQLWATLLATDTRTGLEQTSLDHTLSQLAKMTDYRRMRQLEVGSTLPGILWFVLILGGTLTIASACFFGTSNFRVHLTQVVMLALMISAVLVAIGDINGPFQGTVHIGPAAFERARQSLDDIP